MGKVLDKLKAFMYDKKKDRLGGMDVDRDKILQTDRSYMEKKRR